MSNSSLNSTINEEAPLVQKSKECTTAKNLKLSRCLMYTSHLFAKGSDIIYQFCLVLFLASFTNFENLILVSTFNLFSGLVVCFTGGVIGNFIDKCERLATARVFIGVQNVSVVITTYFCFLLLDSDEVLNFGSGRLKGVPTSTYGLSLLIGIHVFGALANVLDQAITVAIEKDWVVVLSKSSSDQNEWLSETNVTMTQIDLSCKSLAPALGGYLLAIYGDNLKGAALCVGLLNVACLIVEWVCTAFIYDLIPELASKNLNNKSSHAFLLQSESSMIDEEDILPLVSTAQINNKISPKKHVIGGWTIYMNQSTAYSGLALALLYFNILTFGAIMTAYLAWRGMTLESIGLWRGVSAVIGLLGTCAFRISISKLSLPQTGMWSLTFQFLCLSISYVSLFIQNYTLSLTLLIGGVCASRIGLWVFDITMKQLFQECVAEECRGIVGGLQNSLQAFFGLITFVLGIVFPDPGEFYILVASGYVSVGIALFLYWAGFYRNTHSL